MSAEIGNEDGNNIEWVEIDTPEGRHQFATLESARRYLGLSGPGLNLVLNKQPDIRRWKLGQGPTKYLKREDVEMLYRQRNQLHTSSEPRVSPKQLLAGAATILEQVQNGRIDETAIVKWLQLYQETNK